MTSQIGHQCNEGKTAMIDKTKGKIIEILAQYCKEANTDDEMNTVQLRLRPKIKILLLHVS